MDGIFGGSIDPTSGAYNWTMGGKSFSIPSSVMKANTPGGTTAPASTGPAPTPTATLTQAPASTTPKATSTTPGATQVTSFGSPTPSAPTSSSVGAAPFTLGENTATHPVDNTNSWGTFQANPNYDSYLKNVLGGTPKAGQTSDGVGLDQILKYRPDIYSGFFSAYNNRQMDDPNSTAWLNRVGGYTPEDYANYWYNSLAPASEKTALKGQIEGAQNPTPATVPTAPSNPGGTNTDPNGAGLTTGSTSSSASDALAQAMARAQLAVAGRGLNWNDYKDQFSSLYGNIANSIPASDTNPNSWFDPNLANTILAGDQSKAQNQYMQQVQGLTHRVDPHMLDDTINQILQQQSQNSQDMLDRGLKRGQFNDVGYGAGQQALVNAQTAAKSKLLGYAQQDAGNYNTQLQDVYNQAEQAASGYQLGQNFDMSPYQQQIQDILGNYKTAGPGDILNLMGTDPLIDMNSIRMNAGIGQGAVNLNDLDVLDALANRQKMNQLGTGLGSQGSF